MPFVVKFRMEATQRLGISKEDSNQSRRDALTPPTRYHMLPLVLSHSLPPHQC